jgi:hypothetical protein
MSIERDDNDKRLWIRGIYSWGEIKREKEEKEKW